MSASDSPRRPRITRISSGDNPRVKAAIRLRKASNRKKLGRFLAEGQREVSRALAAGLTLDALFVCPESLRDGSGASPLTDTESWLDRLSGTPGARGVEVFELTAAVFRKLTYRDDPDGVLATIHTPQWTWDDLQTDHGPLLVAVGLEKPGNLGAMARTARAFGCGGMIVADTVCEPWNPNAIRASTGAVFDLPVVRASADEAIAQLTEMGIAIWTARVDGEFTCDAANLRGRLALVIGPEDTGLPPRWHGVGQSLSIPMPTQAGTVDSLNASVAASIMLYEAARQRRQSP